MIMANRVASIPDWNQNEAIEAMAQTAGAYAGAAVTALVGGLITGLNGLIRGAVAGAQATYSNLGSRLHSIENTARPQQPQSPVTVPVPTTPAAPMDAQPLTNQAIPLVTNGNRT
jgi:hypothetical protein